MDKLFQQQIVKTVMCATLQQLEEGIYINLPPNEQVNPIILDTLLVEVDGNRIGELHKHLLVGEERDGKLIIWAEKLY